MFEKFCAWYFGPNMEVKDQKPYLLFMTVTHMACFLALFGPIRKLGTAMWVAAMLMDLLMHSTKVHGRFPLAMPMGVLVATMAGGIMWSAGLI